MRYSPILTFGILFSLTLFLMGNSFAWQQDEVLLQFQYPDTLHFRRNVVRDLSVDYEIAGDKRTQMEHSRIELEYSLTPEENDEEDEAEPFALHYEKITLIPEADQETPAITTISSAGVRMTQDGKTLRRSSLKNSPYAGLQSWKAKRLCLPSGAFVKEETLAEHDVYTELHRVNGSHYLILPEAPCAIGESWTADIPAFEIIGSDRLRRLGLQLQMAFQLAVIEERASASHAAKIEFSGQIVDVKNDFPPVETAGVTYQYSSMQQSVQGYAWLDLDNGRLMNTSLTLTVDYVYDTLLADGTAQGQTHRKGTITITEIGLVE